MSEFEKAKQEVEQVCFAYDKAGDTGDIKDWKEYYDLENKLIEKVKIANQPQLTIPKSIAERLDKEIMADAVTKFAMFHEGFERLWLSDELEMYCADKENYALASAYLNPLTRDLVKVVEG